MPVTCIYNRLEGMKVVPLEDEKHFLDMGTWFDNPDYKNNNGEVVTHERQIRREKRTRKHEPKGDAIETGSGTQL